MATKQPYFEDIEEGAKLPAVEYGPVSMTTIVKFAGASGDFAPIHHDVEVAKRRGLPGPIIMAPLKAAYLERFIIDWTGPKGVLRELDMQMRGMDLVGSSLIVGGIVSKKYVKEGKHCVECDLWIENKESGERTTTAKALLHLPAKHKAELPYN